MEYVGGVGDGGRGDCAGPVDSKLFEAEDDYYVTVPLCADVCFTNENGYRKQGVEHKLQRIGLLQLPRLHVERTLFLRLQPAINTMGVECVVTHTPCNLKITRIEQTYFTVTLLS